MKHMCVTTRCTISFSIFLFLVDFIQVSISLPLPFPFPFITCVKLCIESDTFPWCPLFIWPAKPHSHKFNGLASQPKLLGSYPSIFFFAWSHLQMHRKSFLPVRNEGKFHVGVPLLSNGMCCIGSCLSTLSKWLIELVFFGLSFDHIFTFTWGGATWMYDFDPSCVLHLQVWPLLGSLRFFLLYLSTFWNVQ